MVNAIIGDPYKFSIFVNLIKKWSSEDFTWCNGVLLFCIDGELFPKIVTTATLNCEITPLKEKFKNIPINKKLYRMENEKAFIEMYHTRHPENIDGYIDSQYDISPVEFLDHNNYVFGVSDGKNIRIMASKMKYIKKYSRHNLKNINIIETFISKDELNKIILKLEKINMEIELIISENRK
jgi:hypothetical protein